jgi:hypothetical protein
MQIDIDLIRYLTFEKVLIFLLTLLVSSNIHSVWKQSSGCLSNSLILEILHGSYKAKNWYSWNNCKNKF